MTKQNDVVGLGNALMDALIVLPDDAPLSDAGLNKGQMHMVNDLRWKEVYSTLKEYDVDLKTGGSCANTIATLGLLGAKVSYCSQVGDDKFGSIYSEQLRDACGQDALLVADSGSTGKCLSLISPDAERTMLTDLGVAVALPSVAHFEEDIRGAKLLYLTGYLMFGDMRTRMMEAIAVAEEAGVPIALDVADPSVISILREEMLEVIKDHVDIVFLNESESVALCGGSPADALTQLREWCKIVVVKLGAKGSMACRGNEIVQTGIVKVDAIDTTGAGDSYAAGFLYGWTQGWTLQQCVQLGSHVAAHAVSQLGAVVRDRTILHEAIDLALD